MSTVRSTVEQAMSTSGLSGYADRARPVITALENRERNIVTAVRRVATQKGLRNNEVDEILVQVGLAERPQNVTSSGSDTSALQRTVDGLLAFARQHGYRG